MTLLDRPPMMNLHTKASDFLERAEALRKHQDAPSLLYAALELRCGIEARLMEYAAYVVGVSKRNAGQKEIARLGKTIDSAYELGDTIVLVVVRMHSGSTAQFLYAPVTARLREIGKRCGDYLHARPLASHAERNDWAELRGLLHEGCGLLQLACAGELMRPSYAHGWHFLLNGSDPRVEVVQAMRRGEHAGVQVVNITPAGPISYYSGGPDPKSAVP